MNLRRAFAATALVATAVVSRPAPLPAAAAQSVITTFAGGVGYGKAVSVAQDPTGLAVFGDLLYVADAATGWNQRPVVRVLDLRSGVERVVAGSGKFGFAGDGGPAVDAYLDEPNGVAVSPQGEMHFVDMHNSRVRTVDSAGIIHTVAGGGKGQYVESDGWPAGEAFLYGPSDVAFDPAGNMYVSELYEHRVRRVDAGTGIITTYAGTRVAGFSGDGGPAASAQLHNPNGLAVDAAGNLFIADTGNQRVRRVDATTGAITTVVGGGNLEYGTEGPATEMEVHVWAVAVDGSGAVYVNDRDLVRKVGSDGILRRIAGNGAYQMPSTGDAGPVSDGGPATSSPLGLVRDLVVDGKGNLYISDHLRVRRVDPSGTITTVAGNGMRTVGGDGGPAAGAQLQHPKGMVFDNAGNMYIADTMNHRVRKVSPGGAITTFAGTGASTASGDGGAATMAGIPRPNAILVDGAGNVLISSEDAVRRVSPQGTISTVAGGQSYSSQLGDGQPATQVYLRPQDIALDAAGNLYIADSATARIRKVGQAGTIMTVAGGGSPADQLGDGLPAAQAHLRATSLAFDSQGRMLVLEGERARLRRIGGDGVIRTVAGTGAFGYSGDGGAATQAMIGGGGWPGGLAADAAGNVFLVDMGNHRVRMIDPSGTIRTIAGTGRWGLSGDGGPPLEAEFHVPTDAALDAAGNLYVSEGENFRVRRITAAGAGPAPPPPEPAWAIGPPPPARTQGPSFGLWNQPSPAALDGMGTWMAVAADPTAASGQVAPAYLFAHYFGFSSGGALGAVGVLDDPAGKFAVFSVVEPDGTSHARAVAFEWTAGRLYYPFVYRLSPGTWGAWIYDHTGGAWVPIGQLTLPTTWGGLAPTSFTTAQWYGSTAPTCLAFPWADVLFSPPVAYVGTATTTATFLAATGLPGDCPTSTIAAEAGWARHRSGSTG
ncbi:MAG TPA: hypothetical protein VF045_06900 [Acidimicrobiales bacterium]